MMPKGVLQHESRTLAVRGLATVLLIAAAVAVSIATRWPFSRDAVTRELQTHLKGHLAIGQFHQTWFPPGFVAANISVVSRQNGRPHAGNATWIGVRDLSVRGSYKGLLTHALSKATIAGLRLTMPPGGSAELFVSGIRPRIRGIGELEIDDSACIFDNLRVEAKQIILQDVAPDRTVQFRASLLTNKPYGDFKGEGQAGPWRSGRPDETSIRGIFQYANVDLAGIGGLHGILAAKGDFRGTLARIDVSGTLSVPRFRIDGSEHSVDLSASYRASVDARDADVDLTEVEARLARTTVVAKGKIAGDEPATQTGPQGKTAHLELAVNNGRVEDLLNYFSAEKKASMTGAVTLHAFAEVPPGPHFLQKLRLAGDFGVGSAKFTNSSRQIPINDLAASAEARALHVKESKDAEDTQTAVSNLRGHVTVRNGLARLTGVSFDFPGASAAMAGTFQLISKQVDIHGRLRTTGTLPDAASGVKKLILQVATPFLKRKNATVAPFAITGSSSNPKIGLDLSHKRNF